MHQFQRMLVALGFGPDDPSILAHVAAMAPALGVQEVVLLHVVPGPANRELDAELAAEREVALAQAGACIEGPTVTPVVLAGPALPTLLRQALDRSCDLVVVGEGNANTKSATLGEFAGYVVRQAPCSVLMVPRGAEVNLGRIAVPVDFSPRSGELLSLALAVAPGPEAVLALHAFGLPLGWHKGKRSPRDVISELVKEASRRWRSLQRRLGGDAKLIKLDIVVDDDPKLRRGGHVADLVRAIEGYDAGLVIVGSRAATAGAALLLGSTSSRLVNRVFRPVLVVKEPGETMGVLQALGVV